MYLRRIAAVMLLGFSVTGCATVIRGTSTRFDVVTDPAGAVVHTNNGFSCQATPCHFRISRKDGFEVTVSKPGFETLTTKVKSRASADGVAEMTGGNFLIGGIIGSSVDVIDGATNNLYPNPLKLVLVKAGEAAPPPAPESAPAGAPPAPTAASAPTSTDPPKAAAPAS
jgi:hypothetical protein